MEIGDLGAMVCSLSSSLGFHEFIVLAELNRSATLGEILSEVGNLTRMN